MKYLFLLLLGLSLFSCSKPATPDPVETTDALSNTTWIRYGFKSPVSGKEVYYYLSFKPGGKLEDYIKYNKTELAEPPTVSTYTLQVNTLYLNLPSGSIKALVSGNTMTVYGTGFTSVYTRE